MDGTGSIPTVGRAILSMQGSEWSWYVCTIGNGGHHVHVGVDGALIHQRHAQVFRGNSVTPHEEKNYRRREGCATSR